MMRHLPFTALEIANGVWEDKTVARTYRLNNTTGYVIFSAAGVRPIHRMKLATTTLNLGSVRVAW